MGVAVITVVELARKPGSFEIHVKPAVGKIKYLSGSRDPGDAAAKALNAGLSHGDYVIVGVNRVLSLIPAEMLSSGR